MLNFKISSSRVPLKILYSTMKQPLAPTRHPFLQKKGVCQVVADGREAYRKAHWTENSMPYVLSRGKTKVHPFPSEPMPYDMIHLNLKRSL